MVGWSHLLTLSLEKALLPYLQANTFLLTSLMQEMVSTLLLQCRELKLDRHGVLWLLLLAAAKKWIRDVTRSDGQTDLKNRFRFRFLFCLLV